LSIKARKQIGLTVENKLRWHTVTVANLKEETIGQKGGKTELKQLAPLRYLRESREGSVVI